jgi:hypothetical protein
LVAPPSSGLLLELTYLRKPAQELEEDTEVRSQVTLYSTERQRRKAEQHGAVTEEASVSSASARGPNEDESADEEDDDAEAVLVPDGELLEYDSEAETEDEDEDEGTATQRLDEVLDGVSFCERPAATTDDDDL